MRQVGQRLGDRFPPQVWDHRQQAFTPLVSIFIDSTEVEDLGHPVQDGCEVLMIMPLAGG
jgi:molybdopterin converting factor small subunit